MTQSSTIVAEFALLIDTEESQMINMMLEYALPTLVQDSKGAQIQSLAERLSTPVGKMLEANMHHILCHHLLEGEHEPLQ